MRSFDIFLNVYSLDNNLIHLRLLFFALPETLRLAKKQSCTTIFEGQFPAPALLAHSARKKQSVSFPYPIPSSNMKPS